jgi:3-methyladenine DNA glycosylase AlkD
MQASEIRNKLISFSDSKAKTSLLRFFKNDVKVHGVKSKNVNLVAKEAILADQTLSKEDTFRIAEDLYKSGYCEEAWIASALVNSKSSKFTKPDFKTFEKWIDNYIDDWSKCDGFCNHTMWALLERYPEFISKLKNWSISPNLWMRRAGAVSLIIPAKKGHLLQESIELADILLLDKEDLVQKGYGWLLKEQSRKNQKDIYNYVVKNKKDMPRTALRYAIELMPEELRKKAMEK